MGKRRTKDHQELLVGLVGGEKEDEEGNSKVCRITDRLTKR